MERVSAPRKNDRRSGCTCRHAKGRRRQCTRRGETPARLARLLLVPLLLGACAGQPYSGRDHPAPDWILGAWVTEEDYPHGCEGDAWSTAEYIDDRTRLIFTEAAPRLDHEGEPYQLTHYRVLGHDFTSI